MSLELTTSSKIANYLLQIKAIKLETEKPFQWSSGIYSPIYCDNRIVLSFPKIRKLVCDCFVEIIKEKYNDTELVAGVATGGIGMGMLIAEKLDLPFVYVRPQAKKHGRKNQIEGLIKKNIKAIVIEDLISTGKSSLNAVDALKKEKVNVIGLISLFSYELEDAKKNISKSGLNYCSLSNFSDLIKIALSTNYIDTKQKEEIFKWRLNPQKWREAN
jgi:orotate phosphoribosyltransferase|tara:strand:- start:699 stop:1346 length:648 start_codon:yes stop_codon:yes gene_type:complete